MVARQSEAPSFQCTFNDPDTGWARASVAVRKNIDTPTVVATFQAAQGYNDRPLSVGHLWLIQFIQLAPSIEMPAGNLLDSTKPVTELMISNRTGSAVVQSGVQHGFAALKR
jgi:hypothetical protein